MSWRYCTYFESTTSTAPLLLASLASLLWIQYVKTARPRMALWEREPFELRGAAPRGSTPSRPDWNSTSDSLNVTNSRPISAAVSPDAEAKGSSRSVDSEMMPWLTTCAETSNLYFETRRQRLNSSKVATDSHASASRRGSASFSTRTRSDGPPLLA